MAADAKRPGPAIQAPRAIHDCHALLLWIIPQLDKFPRLRRYTLGERIETLLLQVLERLLEAAYSSGRAAQGKWDRPPVAAFFLDLESELLTLQAELRDGRYQPGPYRQFWIRDRKPRLISAAPFRDRVVHHAVMAPLEPWLDRRFIVHSYACRPGKGAHRAVDYYQQQARRYPYVLKVDIARYFPSIDRAILSQQLRRCVVDSASASAGRRPLAPARSTGASSQSARARDSSAQVHAPANDPARRYPGLLGVAREALAEKRQRLPRPAALKAPRRALPAGASIA